MNRLPGGDPGGPAAHDLDVEPGPQVDQRHGDGGVLPPADWTIGRPSYRRAGRRDPGSPKPLFPPKLSAVKLDVLRIVNMKIAVIDGMMIFHQVTHRLVSRHQPDAEEVQQEEEHHQAEKEQDPVRPFQHGDLVRDRGLPVRTRPPDSSPGERWRCRARAAR